MFLFAMALLLAGFAGGVYVMKYKVFPHALLSAAYKTFVTAVFPNHRTPGHLRELYTDRNGGVDISPDRRRALVTFTGESKAVEVRLADGAVLVAFDSLHDVSHLDRFPEERTTRAARNPLREIRYSPNNPLLP